MEKIKKDYNLIVIIFIVTLVGFCADTLYSETHALRVPMNRGEVYDDFLKTAKPNNDEALLALGDGSLRGYIRTLLVKGYEQYGIAKIVIILYLKTKQQRLFC